jgi:DNA (cytosine-5)-methyltransferase 1
LDLFCGAGGASVGYVRAGFEVVGVDIRLQPHYPYDFVRGDALAVDLEGFDAIHASPPYQAYSRATAWRGDRDSHPRLIAATRRRLEDAGVPYVIENVQEARYALLAPLKLCGSQFGLPVRSHRYFEIVPELFELTPPCHHQRDDAIRDHGDEQTEASFRDAIGCHWMTVHEAREAIPPAFTQWIGARLLDIVNPRPARAIQDVPTGGLL